MSAARGNGEGALPDTDYRQLILAAQDALDEHRGGHRLVGGRGGGNEREREDEARKHIRS